MDSRTVELAKAQAAVLAVVEDKKQFSPLTNNEALACRVLRSVGLLEWDSHRRVYIPGPEWTD